MKSEKSDKGQEGLIEYLTKPKSHELGYWCARPLLPNSQFSDAVKKARKVIIHPSTTVLLSLEYEQKIHPRICLWDYRCHQLLWSKSAGDIEKDSAASSVPNKPKLFIRSSGRSLAGNPVVFTADMAINVEADRYAQPNTSTLEILAIKFAGLSHENDMKRTKILIMTESFIILYNCLAPHKHTVISPADIRETNKKPFSSIDVLDEARLLIGLSDGTVKIWSLRTSTVEGSVQALRCAVAHIVVLAPKMGEEMSNKNDKPRLIVIGSDGAAWLYTLPLSDSPYKLGDGVMAESVFYDVNAQSVILQNNDHKLSVWDVSDGNLRTDRKKVHSINRRGSFFKKADSSTTRSLNPLLSYKLDKNMPNTANKITSVAPCYLLDNALVLCSHTHTIAIIQDKSGAGDESEAASTAGGAEKAVRLQLVEEIDVQALFSTYADKLGLSISSDQFAKTALKVYEVYMMPSKPSTLFLATSYGAIVMFLDIQSGKKVLQHRALVYNVVIHEHMIKLIQPPSIQTNNKLNHGYSAYNLQDVQEVILKEKKIDHAGCFYTISASISPSGKYLSLHYPLTHLYNIYSIDSLSILDTGYANEIAWIGFDDMFVIKHPPHYLVQEQKRRASVFGFNSSKASQGNKVFRFSSIIIKQIKQNKISIVQEHASVEDVEQANISSMRVVELISGPLLLINYIHPSYKELDKVNEETGSFGRKQYQQYTYSQFFYYAHGGKEETKLTAVSPLLPCAKAMQWNSSYSLCATLTADHFVNIFSLEKQQLSAIMTIDCFVLEDNLQFYWYESILAISSYHKLECYVWKKSEDNLISDSPYELMGQVKVHSSFGMHEIVQMGNPHTILFQRDGTFKQINIDNEGMADLFEDYDRAMGKGSVRDVDEIEIGLTD